MLGLLLLLLFHPVVLSLALFGMATGIVMGELYRRPRMRAVDVVLGGWVVSVLLLLLTLVIAEQSFHIIEAFQSEWKKQLMETERLMKGYDINYVMPELPLSLFLPVTLGTVTFGVVSVSFLIGRRWLVKRGLPGKSLPSFDRWRFPRSFFVVYLGLILLTLLSKYGIGELAPALPVFTLLILIQGFSFLAFIFRRRGWSRWWVVAFAVLSFPFPLLLMGIHLIGMMDMGFDLRGKIKANDE
ncbi:hypothetical protein JIR001_31740 [Polycladomyces abyssicola]|uniref:DUF2232 domain-containing protein n=1 Tax=Polycladomyces abyssicola TaxID=1125966 RepID=A0A8D5UJ58_9BACL|nr:hypothetical protein JIR001_31740 [Polycladomyces abyssicola]